MSYFGPDAAPIDFSSSFENVFGPPPVNPGQDSPDFGLFTIDTQNYNMAKNTWNSMSPEQRAGTTDANGVPVNNFIMQYGQTLGQNYMPGNVTADPFNPVGDPIPGTTLGSNNLPAASDVVGDLFPDPSERVMPTMDMVRVQSLEGPMLSGNFLDTRQNPQVYQLPTQGYASQRQDPFGVNVKQTTRPLNIPERIIPAPPQQPLPQEVGMADPTQGGVTN